MNCKRKLQTYISNLSGIPNNVGIKSNATINQIHTMLKGTGLAGLEYAFYNAEKTYGVNAIFLMAVVATESQWGTSPRAINDNNLSGFEVYTEASRGAIFPTKAHSILATARVLKNDYISKGRKDIWTISKIYCPPNSTSWSSLVNEIAIYDLLEKLK